MRWNDANGSAKWDCEVHGGPNLRHSHYLQFYSHWRAVISVLRILDSSWRRNNSYDRKLRARRALCEVLSLFNKRGQTQPHGQLKMQNITFCIFCSRCFELIRIIWHDFPSSGTTDYRTGTSMWKDWVGCPNFASCSSLETKAVTRQPQMFFTRPKISRTVDVIKQRSLWSV